MTTIVHVPRALLALLLLKYIYYVPIPNVNFPLGPQSNKTETIKNATPRPVCRGNTSDISGETRLDEHVRSVRSTGICSCAAREHNIIMICITRIPLLLLWYNAGGRYILILYYHGDLRWDILRSLRVFSTTTITNNALETGYMGASAMHQHESFPLPSTRLWSFFTYIFSYDKIYCRIIFRGISTGSLGTRTITRRLHNY